MEEACGDGEKLMKDIVLQLCYVDAKRKPNEAMPKDGYRRIEELINV